MSIKSRGRGTAAAFGLVVLFAGLIGGGVLYWMSARRHDNAVDGFARASVGCTTTLDFTETGTFYVYEEPDTVVELVDGECVPSPDLLQVFGFELTGPSGPVVPRRDDSISYDTGDFFGQSVARFEIDEAGEYEIEVFGDDALTVAAVGRDPDDGVDELRQRAVIVAIAGVVIGLLLLVLAGRRSKRAAEYATPEGPGWGPRPAVSREEWEPEAPRLDQVPVNPHEPDLPASSLPERTPAASPWAPPKTGEMPSADAPPAPPAPPAPTLPDAPGRPSGASLDANGTVHDESHPDV